MSKNTETGKVKFLEIASILLVLAAVAILTVEEHRELVRRQNIDYVMNIVERADTILYSYDDARQAAIERNLPKLLPVISEKEAESRERYSVSEALALYKTAGTEHAAERIAALEPLARLEGKYYEKGGKYQEVTVRIRDGITKYSVSGQSSAPLGEKVHEKSNVRDISYFLDTDNLTLTYDRWAQDWDSIETKAGFYVSKKSANYTELLEKTWEETTYTRKPKPKKNYFKRVPFKGMEEEYIDKTVLGTHQEREVVSSIYSKAVDVKYRWYDSTGTLAYVATCRDDKVVSVSRYGTYSQYYDSEGNPTSSKAPKNPRNEKIIKSHSYVNSPGSSGKSSSSDPYDSDRYSDAEEFADDWEDEFGDWDEAWDYWNDRH